jgi:hypothetical protein
MVSSIFGTRVMAALTTLFNVLALNLVLLIVCLPVITAPAALSAATTALDQWRNEGEDRVVHTFLTTLRTRPFWRTTLLAGVPLLAVVLGVLEVRHFARGGALADRFAMGLGTGALLITFLALGYVFLLSARYSWASATEFWSVCVRLAIRNLVRTGPLFLVEIAAATALTLIDPALLVLGLPVFLLQLIRLTTQSGLRRINTANLGCLSGQG